MMMKRQDYQLPISHTRMPNYVRRPIAAVRARRIAAQNAVQPQLTTLHKQEARWQSFKQLDLRLANLRLSHSWEMATLAVVVVVVFVVSMLSPLFSAWQLKANYDLSAAKSLLGTTPKYLQDKLKYDMRSNAWQFNEAAAPSLAESKDSVSVGDVTYSAKLPGDILSSDGLTLTDTNSKVDIKLKPQFPVSVGQEQDGHVVYPLVGSKSQLVYSFKNNGVKEDIILYQSPGDSAEFSYSMQLPNGMEARIQKDGSVGIFGGDPTLFGDISFGSDKDKALVDKARQNSAKTHLYYEIPAPVITGSDVGGIKAAFAIDGDDLTVKVSGLADAHYPLSIDPSFVMNTSGCAWQSSGNNEDNISYSGCQISRSGLSGGELGSWQYNNGSTTSLSAAPKDLDYSVTVINGTMYLSGESSVSAVYYASVNQSTGVVGSFVATTASPSPTYDVRDSRAVTVNGYLYLIGGINASTTVIKAKPASNGDITSWSAVASLNTGRLNFGVATYSGRIYVMGGCSVQSSWPACTTVTATTEYASVRADGSLTNWTISSSLATGSLQAAVQFNGAFVYNGYLYSMGGTNATFGSVLSGIFYAPISSNGSIGQWISIGTLPAARYAMGVAVSNGYAYLLGGRLTGGSTNTTLVAKIYASGTLGPFQSSTNFTGTRTMTGATAYNGRVYIAGGCTSAPNICSTAAGFQDLQYATISTTLGNTSSYTSGTFTGTARINFASVAYRGYIYVIGGTTSTAGGTGQMLNTTLYAPINTNGSLGTWATASTGFNNVTTESGHFCTTSGNCPGRVNLSAAAYNGYVYIAGGWSNASGLGTETNWSDVQSAPICTGSNTVGGCTTSSTPGDLGNWSTVMADFVTSSTTTYAGADGRHRLGMQVYNGYLYLIGGHNSEGTGSYSSSIYFAPLTTSGGVGSFSLSGVSLPSARQGVKTFVEGGRLYIVGGGTGGGWANTLNDADDVRFATICSGAGVPDAGCSGAGALSTSCPSGYTCSSGSWVDANAAVNSGSSSSFATAGGLQEYSVNFDKGYLYIAGGNDGTNGTTHTFATVYKAKMNSNGSFGSWSTIASINTKRFRQAGVVANGFLYVVGGCSNLNGLNDCNSAGEILTSYDYAQIYNGGGGMAETAVGPGSLPTARTGSMGAAANGYIYSIGGASSLSTPTASTVVYYANGGANYTPTGWTTTTSLNTGRYDAAVVVYGGYVYVLGGRSSSTILSTGEFAKIKGDGTLGSWTQFTMSDARQAAAAFAYNGYLYIAGGTSNGTTGLSTVKYAAIGTGGTPGSWSTTTASFTNARYGLQGFSSSNGSVYIMGGYDGTNYYSDVQYATPTGGGDITSWSIGPSFPFARTQFASAVANGYVYIYSGKDGGGVRTDMFYAPIIANGGLGQWDYAGRIAGNTQYRAGATTDGGFLYLIGGCSGTCASDLVQTGDVYRVPIQGTPNVAHYSLVLATDLRTLPASYITTVATQSGGSNINTALSLATSTSGFTYGAGDVGIASATKYPFAVTNSDGGTAYTVLITLDDTASVYFGESATAGSSVSYFKLNYHPNPSMRLRGGKTFNSSVLQSLDAP